MTVLVATVQWFRGGIGYALELDDAVHQRFVLAKLKLESTSNLLMNDLVDRLPKGVDPTQDDVVRFLDHMDHDWGLARLPLPKRIKWQQENESS